MMRKDPIDRNVLENIDNAIILICNEMQGKRTDNVIALAKVLRDLTVARAILKNG